MAIYKYIAEGAAGTECMKGKRIMNGSAYRYKSSIKENGESL